MMRALPLFILLIILTGCSVQKRVYQRGYYVSWKHENVGNSKAHDRNAIAKTKDTKIPVTETPVKELTFEVNNEPSVSEPVLAAADAKLHIPPDDDCDVMIFKDGTELKVKIIERTPYEFKYRRCDLPEGPMYTVKHSTLFMIKYANGTREVFTTESPSPATQYQRPNQT
jgi:hypothetical protein